MIQMDDGAVINNMEEACKWLREAWMYEPYNIWYEDGYIYGEPVRGHENMEDIQIHSLEEFKFFVDTH